MAMECYEAHTNALEEEEESVRKVVRELSAEERIEQLRRTTEEMLTSRTEYVESTRSLALRAIKVRHHDMTRTMVTILLLPPRRTPVPPPPLAPSSAPPWCNRAPNKA